MQKIFIYQIILSLALFGCQSSQEKAKESDLFEKDKFDPKELIAPRFESTTDSNTIRASCEPIINEIDISLSELQKIEKKTSFYGVDNTPVSIWYSSSNVPVKIECAVTNDSGVFSGVFQFYFIDGQLWYSDQIFARYLFSADSLQFWLDENWKNNNVPDSELKVRENVIREEIWRVIAE
jgi:hypothetical protein